MVCGTRKTASAITGRLLERYQQDLFFCRKRNGQPLASSTQYSRIALIKLWFSWMEQQNLVSCDPASKLELPLLCYRLPSVLTKEQVELVLQQPKVQERTGIRDRAIPEMLYSTGMRRMELLGLKVFDFDRSCVFWCSNNGSRGGTSFLNKIVAVVRVDARGARR